MSSSGRRTPTLLWLVILVFKAISTASPTFANEVLSMRGANVDLAQILPGDPNHVDTDRGNLFDVARLAAFNTLRVTTFEEWGRGERGTSYGADDWRKVGALAKANDITLIPLVGLSREESLLLSTLNNDGQRERQRTSFYERKVDLIVRALGPSRCKFIVDLDNERELTPSEMLHLRKLAKFVRSKHPGVKLTVGGWKAKRPDPKPGEGQYVANYPDDGAPLADIEDIVSVHLYDEALDSHETFGLYARKPMAVPGAVSGYLKRIEKWARGKPILVSEFGAPNGVLPTRYHRNQEALTPEIQASTVDGVLQGIALARRDGVNVIGGLAWIMAPRGGAIALGDESNEWALSLIDPEKRALTLFPAFWAFCRKETSTSSQCPTNFPSSLMLVDKSNFK